MKVYMVPTKSQNTDFSLDSVHYLPQVGLHPAPPTEMATPLCCCVDFGIVAFFSSGFLDVPMTLPSLWFRFSLVNKVD